MIVVRHYTFKTFVWKFSLSFQKEESSPHHVLDPSSSFPLGVVSFEEVVVVGMFQVPATVVQLVDLFHISRAEFHSLTEL